MAIETLQACLLHYRLRDSSIDNAALAEMMGEGVEQYDQGNSRPACFYWENGRIFAFRLSAWVIGVFQGDTSAEKRMEHIGDKID